MGILEVTNVNKRFGGLQALSNVNLDIPAGTAIRFEPGQSREVNLVAYAGERKVYGFRGEVMGVLGEPT